MKNKKNAFTLAELITVLIILGIVALITIPSVINTTQKRMEETSKRRAEYLVSQIALQLQAECPRFRCTDGKPASEHLTNLLPKKHNSKLSFSSSDTKITVTIEGRNEQLKPEYTLVSSGSYTCTGDGCCTDTETESMTTTTPTSTKTESTTTTTTTSTETGATMSSGATTETDEYHSRRRAGQ